MGSKSSTNGFWVVLMPETPEEETEHVVETSKPKFSSPIWLDEIHNNKIFNKQRSIINTIWNKIFNSTLFSYEDHLKLEINILYPVLRQSLYDNL